MMILMTIANTFSNLASILAGVIGSDDVFGAKGRISSAVLLLSSAGIL